PIYSPLVPLEEILDPALLDSSVGHAGQKYQGLFDDTDGGSGVLSVGHGDRFDKLKADFLVDQLPQVSLYGVSNVGQIQLMSVVETIALGSQEDKSIDEMGLRYLIMMNLYEYEKRRSPGRSTPHLCYRDINWALNSDTQIALIQHCRSIHPGRGLDWHAFRSMGLAMWIRSRSMLLQEIERLARDIYSLNDRDPSSCGMFFLALKKPRVLFGLWKMAHGHPEQAKMVRFLSNDFSLPRWKTAANKNAFALLGKARYWDAITFFLLGDRLEDAAL
ncbi:regulator of (H+)-ATPase in vacuolar membrane, partial [Spiromyces aspiralis]